MQATYDITQSYDWNYQHGPIFSGEIPERKVGNKVKIWDFELNSGIGVPAGPLLNSNFIKLYAELGFDLPIYKTVRTITRECHPAPNCVYVETGGTIPENRIGGDITVSGHEPADVHDITITNSFGVPSKEPKEWMADVEKANSYMGVGQAMIVSCSGTPGVKEDIADDYADCAAMAVEAGAKIIEINYSCPNVRSKEGSIFQDAELSAHISKKVKAAIGNVPLMIKLGHFPTEEAMAQVVIANAPYVDGIAGINTIAMNVYDQAGNQALPGEGRLKSGLCGAGITNYGFVFTERAANIKKANNFDFLICGVGGITHAEDFDKQFNLGADMAMSATGAMWNPMLAMEYHNR